MGPPHTTADVDSSSASPVHTWAGAAYVFVRAGGTWTEQAFIKANNARPYNWFGVKLALRVYVFAF